MKKSMHFVLLVFLCLSNILWSSCNDKEKDKKTTGNIYGVVTVKSTAEPMRATGVALNVKFANEGSSGWKLLTKTVTYDDGHFEFNDLPISDELENQRYDYGLIVEAEGYMGVGQEVKILAGQTTHVDIQLEKKDTYLNVRTLNAVSSGNQVEFNGSVSCSNNSYRAEEVGFVYAKSSASINAGVRVTAELATAFKVVVKDLEKGTYQVQSYAKNSLGTSFGERQVFTINCYPAVQTLNASNISDGSASFNARVIYEGEPAYTERGFVYSNKFENPGVDDPVSTTKKVVVSGRNTDFSANVTGLTKGETYYVRAYIKNSDGAFYGEAVKFKASSVLADVVILDDLNLMVQKVDMPLGEYTWDDAKSACQASRLGGYSDWRMPTKAELLAICQSDISGFSTEAYWTSTVNASYSSYYYVVIMNKCDASEDRYIGKAKCKVRAVRTITE